MRTSSEQEPTKEGTRELGGKSRLEGKLSEARLTAEMSEEADQKQVLGYVSPRVYRNNLGFVLSIPQQELGRFQAKIFWHQKKDSTSFYRH